MIMKLKKKKKSYAQVHVNLLKNKRLSLKAKGLGAVLESYSDDFQLSMKSIEINSNDGKKSIKSAIKELEEGLYLFRFQTRDEAGLFCTYWAFDSQKLDFNYLKEMIDELESIECITPNNLEVYRGCRDGHPVTGTPSRTPYNNNITIKSENKIKTRKESFDSDANAPAEGKESAPLPFPEKSKIKPGMSLEQVAAATVVCEIIVDQEIIEVSQLDYRFVNYVQNGELDKILINGGAVKSTSKLLKSLVESYGIPSRDEF